MTILKIAPNFPCGNDSAAIRRWRKNTAGRQHRLRGSHAAAEQVPLCWSLDLSWTPCTVHTQTCDRMYTQFTLGQSSTCAGLFGTWLLRQSGSVCTFYSTIMISRITRHESYWVFRRRRKDVQSARKWDMYGVYRNQMFMDPTFHVHVKWK